MPIKTVIGCCNYVFGEGLKKLLQDESEIDVIGIFDESADFKEIVKLNPDVILADLNIFRSFPEDLATDNLIKILLLGERAWLSTAHKLIPDLVSKGVVGILPPGTDSELLRKALKAVTQGELWIGHKIVKNAFSFMSIPEKKVEFTKTEREILFLICQGYRNKEIAQKLNISEQTVKSHCNRIYKKVGVSDKVQLVLYIYRTWPDWIKIVRTKIGCITPFS
jgi:DNA-binding NarL/FixJ family response regulator